MEEAKIDAREDETEEAEMERKEEEAELKRFQEAYFQFSDYFSNEVANPELSKILWERDRKLSHEA